jgi:hypothetical protein
MRVFILVQQQSQAPRKEEVLDSLSKQASLLRRKLGESLPIVEKFDGPLEQATTSSLRAYSLGMKQHWQIPQNSRFLSRRFFRPPAR